MGAARLSLVTFALGILLGLFGRGYLRHSIYLEPRASKLMIFNNTADSLNFTIMERRAARFMKWQPCNHPSKCGGRAIPPGRSGFMPYERIYQWYPGCDVVVFWWQLLPDSLAGNGYRLDGIYEEYSSTPVKAVFNNN
ncbi:MAG: hypothetical protein V3W14_00750 [Candidatus Neomarinimicrobiota bacterium]